MASGKLISFTLPDSTTRLVNIDDVTLVEASRTANRSVMYFIKSQSEDSLIVAHSLSDIQALTDNALFMGTDGNGKGYCFNVSYVDRIENDGGKAVIFYSRDQDADFTVKLTENYADIYDIVAGSDGSTATINHQTGTSYVLVASDAGRMVEMDNGSANTVEIPLDATVDYPEGTVIGVYQKGAGQTTITGAVGVTINSTGGLTAISARYVAVSIMKTGANEWLLNGSLA